MSSYHGPLLLCAGAEKQRNLCAHIGVPDHVGCGPGFVGPGKSRLIEYQPFETDPAKVRGPCAAVLSSILLALTPIKSHPTPTTHLSVSHVSPV